LKKSQTLSASWGRVVDWAKEKQGESGSIPSKEMGGRGLQKKKRDITHKGAY